MKRILLTAFVALASLSAFAQTSQIEYHDASEFPVFGKITDDTPNRYDRLPGYLENVARKPVWNLGKNSAGLYIRFKAEGSIALYFRWKPTRDNSMEHMADTGTKGLDLYALSDEFGWRYLRCARPKGSGTYEAKLICGKPAKEYMLYLPLYDGIDSLEIGIEKGGTIGQPDLISPNAQKPVIMYGSSILQGGCASRPGMAHTNILARMLDREVINLGFSGNAKIDYEIAELMASHKDPGVFVLDYVPNCTADMIDEKGEQFFRQGCRWHNRGAQIFLERHIRRICVFGFDENLGYCLLLNFVVYLGENLIKITIPNRPKNIHWFFVVNRKVQVAYSKNFH